MKEVSEEMNESKTCLRFSQRLPYQPALHTQAPAVKVYIKKIASLSLSYH